MVGLTAVVTVGGRSEIDSTGNNWWHLVTVVTVDGRSGIDNSGSNGGDRIGI